MPSSCKDIRAALAECLQYSDCVLIERHTPTECMKDPLVNTLPTRCLQLRKGYTECKRGLVDMRKRFRGNQPVALSKELEGGVSQANSGGGGQLYAGGSAYGGIKSTDGRNDEDKSQ